MVKKSKLQLLDPKELSLAEDANEMSNSKGVVTEVADFIEGAITSQDSLGLHGWVWHRGEPYRALTVQLYANDNLITQAVADRFDMDLVERHIGNGKHAFTLRAKSWPDFQLPVELEVRIKDTSFVLGKIQINNQNDIEGLAESAPTGHVDGVINGSFVGWAFNRSNLRVPISVDIIVDGDVIGTVACTDFRKDLKAAGYVDGNCGFSFPLPLFMLDGKTHSIAICYAGTQSRLPSGTMLFGLSKESNLTKCIDDLVMSLKLCQSELAMVEQRLLTRHEALLAIQRENIERELQVLRKLLIIQSEQSNEATVSISESTTLEESADKQIKTANRLLKKKVNDASR